MKKVILIGSVPPPYHGSSIYFQNLLNSDIRNVFEIHHLDISDHRNLDNLSKLDFTNVYLALKNLKELLSMLRKEKPDLVYIPVASNYLPYLRDGLFILTTSYFSKAKIIIHLHEGSYFRSEFYRNAFYFYKKFIKYTLSKVNTAIVFTEGLKSNFEGFVENIIAFPNGLKREFENSENKNESISEKKFRINFLGNLFESKGVLDVLNASVILKDRTENIEFNFAGAWSEKEYKTRQKAENIISENRLEGIVNFKGVLTGKEKDKFLQQTDILVFPTWYPYEGCPLVIIEAMSYSIPVISTRDAGAIPEMVIDGKTGILVDKKNPEQIAESVLKLIENKELSETMGKAGRESYEKNFTMEVNIRNMINTFNKVIN